VDRAAKWLAALCIVASSAGCVLTQDLPDPALDIPQGYKAARLTNPDAPPTLDWWRGFRSTELTDLMEQAQTVNLDIAAATARFIERQRLEHRGARGRQLYVIAQRQL
jgi:outer membrane protein TolC